jgi:hypothetical protein
MTAANLDTLSVEERVNRALHRLTVVERFCRLSAANEDTGNQADVDADAEANGDFWDGLLELIEQTRKELDPIRHAPAEVGNWTPEADPAAKGDR